MSNIQTFFDPVKDFLNCRELNYELVDQFVATLIAMSKVANQSVYIIDYNNQEFSYVSSHPLFLCGYKADQVKELGYNYFEKVVQKDDLDMLMEINKKGFEFFYNLPSELRTQCFISYDFRLKHKNGNTFLINHKLTHFYLTERGDMWLALCLINLSVNDKPGNVYIQMLNEPIKYSYSFKSKKFTHFQAVTISDRERQILELAAQGYSAIDIATKIYIDINTVKYHKRNIFKKLGVKNISEAIYYASINNMI